MKSMMLRLFWFLVLFGGLIFTLLVIDAIIFLFLASHF